MAMLPSMDLSLSLQRGIRRGMLMVARERSWRMTVAVLLGVAILLQCLLAGILGVRGVQMQIVSNGEVRLDLNPGVADRDLQELYASLRALPFVQDVTYVPDAFAVTLVSLRSYEMLSSFLREPRWSSVVRPASLSALSAQELHLYELLQTTQTVKTGLWLLAFLVVAVLAVVVVELMRRRAAHRRKELQLETLLGASDVDVIAPVATHMSVFLLLALAGGTALVLGAFFLLPLVSSLWSEGSFLALHHTLRALMLAAGAQILLVELLSVPLLATAGAILGLRSYRI